MSDLSPLSGVRRKLDFGAVRAAFDPHETYVSHREQIGLTPPRCRCADHLAPESEACQGLMTKTAPRYPSADQVGVSLARQTYIEGRNEQIADPVALRRWRVDNNQSRIQGGASRQATIENSRDDCLVGNDGDFSRPGRRCVYLTRIAAGHAAETRPQAGVLKQYRH